MAGGNGNGTVSAALDTMVCDLLEDFLGALAEGENPGVLLCLEDGRANRYEAAFDEDGAEACIEGAQRFVIQHAEGLPAEHLGVLDRYAYAYAGGVELEGGFEDAVLVSFYERGMDTGYSAYVLYQGFGAGDGFMWSDPEPAGEEAPLI